MSFTFYSDYIRHCLRFYVSYGDTPRFYSDVDRLNWTACDQVLQQYDATDRAIIHTIYGNGDTLADNIYTTARKYKLNQDNIWKLVNDTERKIAKARGLL